ncbi:DUF3298 and DUF4163 domain-containing protein [Lutibacter sp. B2]|nr:DUF3298 and DUF4163 domain-containing protein [Lutibacter sp. B2]
MNKKMFYKVAGSIILGSLCIFSTACIPTAKADSQMVKNQSAEITAKQMSIDENYITGDINIPVISKLQDKNVEKKVNEIFEKDINEFVDEKVTMAKRDYKEENKDDQKEEVNVTYKVAYQNENLVSIVIDKKAKQGKNNTFTIRKGYTIDLKSGKQVNLYHLFDSREEYKNIIKSFAKDKGKELINREILDDNYYIKEGSVVIYIDGYIIGESDKIDSEFEIPFSNFKYGINTKTELSPYAVDVNIKNIKLDTDYITGNINIPSIKGLEDKKIEEKINKRFEKEAMDFKTEMEKEGKEGLKDAKKYGYTQRPYGADIYVEEYKNEGDILSIYMLYYTYTGGAHGASNGVGYNIDLKTGELMNLKDLFRDGYDYKKAIDEKVKAQIDSNGQEIIAKGVAEGQKEEAMYTPYKGFTGISDNQTFYLKEDRLYICFGSYEIGCYAEGMPVFEIPLSEFEEDLK